MCLEERKMEIVCLVRKVKVSREDVGSVNKYDCLFYLSKLFYEDSFESYCFYLFGVWF